MQYPRIHYLTRDHYEQKYICMIYYYVMCIFLQLVFNLSQFSFYKQWRLTVLHFSQYKNMSWLKKPHQ